MVSAKENKRLLCISLMPSLYLIDGHAQFFRAYHAIRTGMTSPVTKEPTNMTFGFVGMLLKVLREYKPDYLAVVIDAAGDKETFRSELYADYKANRKEPPEDLGPQIDRCLRVMEQMRIPVIAIPGVEADDVIATIVRRLQREQPELSIRIVSKDKDLTQLLNHNVELFDVHKDAAVTAADTFGFEGVKPEHVRDILALMGDAIDNVPGVPGVGPKTAAQLILQFGSLENLLANLDQIKGKRRENIESAKNVLALSKQLVTLKDDLEVSFDLERARARPGELPVDQLLGTLRELGFNRYQDELKALAGGGGSAGEQAAAPTGKEAPPAPARSTREARRRAAGEFDGGLFAHLEASAMAAAPVGEVVAAPMDRGEYECVKTAARLDALIKEIRKAGEFAVDVETTGLSPISADLCGVSISIKPRTGVYIPVRSPEPENHLDVKTALDRLRPVLEDPSIRKIGHNLKFDMNVFRKHGVRVRGELWDTMIASYVIDATRSSHRLDVLALALLQHTNIPLADLIGSGKNERCFDEAPLEQATQYAAEDADVALRLRDAMQPQLRAMGLVDLFAQVEVPLVEVLAEMEWNGIRVDPDELDRQGKQLEGQIAALRSRISNAAPFPFSPDSPKQLAAVLFNKPDQDPPGIGLKVLKRGKTGPSTDVEVLEKLAGDPEIQSELPRLIVEYRQLTKLVNTYLVALKEAINPATNRVHASFNQTVAATGRLSASDPNLQNIPIRTDIGREIRRAFVAEKDQNNWLNRGSATASERSESAVPSALARSPRPTSLAVAPSEPNVLITADYSQIELRLLAHFSEDPALIEAFESGQDIHRAVAAEVYGVRPEDVTPMQRNSAKMVNFGIVYGITAFGLARRLSTGGAETSKEQAGKIIADYKARFSRIDAFLDQCIQMAQTHGYVETILKRRRAVPQITARNPQERALGERVAINTVVQGSAADLIKVAMIDIHGHLEPARAGSAVGERRESAARPNALGMDPPPPPAATALARTRMVLQIHDELVFETPRSHAEAVAAFVKQRMQNAMTLRVPLVVEAAWSENWIDAK